MRSGPVRSGLGIAGWLDPARYSSSAKSGGVYPLGFIGPGVASRLHPAGYSQLAILRGRQEGHWRNIFWRGRICWRPECLSTFSRSRTERDYPRELEILSKGAARMGPHEPSSLRSQKGSFHILSFSEPYGEDFKLLGVTFDVGMTMRGTVDELVAETSWKLKMLLRTARFYSSGELISLYKAHILSFVEYRTLAVYHATRDLLKRIDKIQSKFLEAAGIDDGEALMSFSLAPLETRRDIAMLGVLHRTVLGKGPPHFRKLFQIETGRTIRDPRTYMKGAIVKRSALGLVFIYNQLPASLRNASRVKVFQGELQNLLKERLSSGCSAWKTRYSPRATWYVGGWSIDDFFGCLVRRPVHKNKLARNRGIKKDQIRNERT